MPCDAECAESRRESPHRRHQNGCPALIAETMTLDELVHADARDDPFPLYHRLRNKHPVLWCGSSRTWFVTSHADVVSLLRDARISAASLPRALSPVLGLANIDPPDHTRLRRALGTRYMAHAHEDLRSAVEEIVDAQIGAIAAAPQPVDLISMFARVIPSHVNARLIGLPSERVAQFSALTAVFGQFLGGIGGQHRLSSVKNAKRLLLAERQAFERIVAERAAQPGADLLSALVIAQKDGLLSQEEVLALGMEILFAGQETTTDLIGNGLLVLLRHPEQRRALLDTPALMKTAVEELLRYESPVQITSRVAMGEIELQGQTIRGGDRIALCLGAANRDPEAFHEPDVLDLARTPNRHLAFGAGSHFCMGAALARVEAHTALDCILRRFPEMRLVDEPLEWKDSPVYRGLRSLRVLL